MKLLIVDWEFSQLNSIVYDLGQMLAELYQLKHFKDIDSAIWIIR
jgi:thiamine kinase-like enzyme